MEPNYSTSDALLIITIRDEVQISYTPDEQEQLRKPISDPCPATFSGFADASLHFSEGAHNRLRDRHHRLFFGWTRSRPGADNKAYEPEMEAKEATHVRFAICSSRSMLVSLRLRRKQKKSQSATCVSVQWNISEKASYLRISASRMKCCQLYRTSHRGPLCPSSSRVNNDPVQYVWGICCRHHQGSDISAYLMPRSACCWIMLDPVLHSDCGLSIAGIRNDHHVGA